MLDELRDRIAAYLSGRPACVICTSGKAGVSAVPVWYRNRKLEIDCLVPRWADVVYHLEADPQVLLIFPGGGRVGDCPWLEYRGMAQLVVTPEWGQLLPKGTPHDRPENRYAVFHVRPQRIDLVDESRGWGARETLEV